MQHLDSTSAVIEALGGYASVASMTGRKYNAVHNWSRAEHFPANTYLTLTQELRKRGKSAPAQLWKMSEPAEAVQ